MDYCDYSHIIRHWTMGHTRPLNLPSRASLTLCRMRQNCRIRAHAQPRQGGVNGCYVNVINVSQEAMKKGHVRSHNVSSETVYADHPEDVKLYLNNQCPPQSQEAHSLARSVVGPSVVSVVSLSVCVQLQLKNI